MIKPFLHSCYLHGVQITHEFPQKLSTYLAAYQQLARTIKTVLVWYNNRRKLTGHSVQLLRVVNRHNSSSNKRKVSNVRKPK